MLERLLELAVVAIFAVVGVQMLRTYLGKRKIRSDFDYAMRDVARGAVKLARKRFKVDLDFSPISIDRLEEMLGKIHERHLQNPLSDDELAVQSMRWGAYNRRSAQAGAARQVATRFRKDGSGYGTLRL
jgi:hypothetical protein